MARLPTAAGSTGVPDGLEDLRGLSVNGTRLLLKLISTPTGSRGAGRSYFRSAAGISPGIGRALPWADLETVSVPMRARRRPTTKSHGEALGPSGFSGPGSAFWDTCWRWAGRARPLGHPRVGPTKERSTPLLASVHGSDCPEGITIDTSVWRAIVAASLREERYVTDRRDDCSVASRGARNVV
jgi:hypothetical protein